MISRTWQAAVVTACMVVGCGRLNTEAEDAADAVDTTESTSNESALMDLASVEGMTAACTLPSEDVAELALSRLKANVRNNSCVTATRSGNAVDYALNQCTGRWGRITVTGTIHVVYTRNADCSIDAVATGKGIQVNKATIDLDATAHYTKSAAGLETVAVSTRSKGAGPRAQLDHHGNYTITRDSSSGSVCRTLDGTWSTDWTASRGSATTSTVASGIKKCGDSCPVAGGKVEHNGFAGRKVMLNFDGSAAAKWESSNGKSGTVDLDCTP